ncbi:MAG: hypothetical protein FWG39_01440 [Alphaproteobacteria bacterium]|nr:hypothetical protein [Alphaproteobacteria bacterium]
MQIKSLEISDKTTLVNYFKHNTVLFGNADMAPYLDADISVRTVKQSDIVASQTYVYTSQLEFLAELDRQLQENHGIDFLNQKGFITYEIDGVRYTLYPPIVEITDGKPLLVDGTHRITYAARQNKPFTAVFVRGVSKDWKPSTKESPAGWAGIREFEDFKAEAPADFIKRYKRYPTSEEYKYYFRHYRFPGQTKIMRVDTDVDLVDAARRTGEVRNLRNEREIKWVLPKFVLPKTHSYLIKSGTIVQGYIPAGHNLSLDGNILKVGGNPVLNLNPENLTGIRDGILDFMGNFPDESEFRYRAYDKKFVATFKNVTTNAGRDRAQVEFDITKSEYNALCGFAAGQIQKSRCLIPDGHGVIEIDFYDTPNLSFVSIEREFLEDEDPATYVLPNWLARMHPINVTHEPAFKNKNITKILSAGGQYAANARFEEIMRTKQK